MIEAQALPATASLASVVVRRRHPLRLASPRVALPAVIEDIETEGWGEDLRFFLTSYAAGFVFFLVMLS